MESIDILTGQNVIIRYQSATILQRAGGRLLDSFFTFVYLLSVIFSFRDMLDHNDAATITFIILLLPALGYHFIFESILGGKTPGKMIVKIKVTNMYGSISGIGAYFLRWILSPIDFILSGGLGALFILLSRNHQRLGDMAAGTIVVKTDPSLAFDLDESYYVFPDNYEPTFIHVDRLTTGQIAFITNLLVEPKNRAAVSSSLNELANKVKNLLNVNRI